MSRAGTKSNQGDDYQRLIVLHFLIRLLNDDNIVHIQAESNGLPGSDIEISVDDIVISYIDGHRVYIQAKKNQSTNRAWTLADLKDELPKIRDQLENDANATVMLYSRTPFGDLHSLVEASCEYPDITNFRQQSGKSLIHLLEKLSSEGDRSEEVSFYLLRSIKFGPHHSFEDWSRINKSDLSQAVSKSDLAIPILEKFINVHQSKLETARFIIAKEDVIRELNKVGSICIPKINENEIIEQFEQISQIGRDWKRTVGSEKIERPELGALISHIDSGKKNILIKDRPGSGKTCLLLDLVDYLETKRDYGLLFIKGDRFQNLDNREGTSPDTLPSDIVGLCSRLSEYRPVVIILDSLDVLSLNRKHGVLNYFLTLIDRLSNIDNISIISACRSFDLHYDPLLRDRKWSVEISLNDFDFETIVLPLLNKWGISKEKLDKELIKLLQLPQNLNLFDSISQREDSVTIQNSYQLHETYLDEVVLKDNDLGALAMTTLYDLADKLIENRIQMTSSAAFPINESIKRRLVSNAVLHQDRGGSIGFSHQTLLDTVVVHSALARNNTLASFIKSHPPFPFLRPAVRVFIFHLRTCAPEMFSRQIWEALNDNDIAYHFRRLITESLAEIKPSVNDWPLIRRLFLNLPDQFRRLFWLIESDEWFLFITEKWLPFLDSFKADKEWYTLLALRLSRWMNSHPDKVISLWVRALSENWCAENRNISWNISYDLQKFTYWNTDGVFELLEKLLMEKTDDRFSIGHAFSLFAENTNKGDDLLWNYIIKDIRGKDINDIRLGDKLNCRPHKLHKETFLEEHFLNSSSFLDTALKSLIDWISIDPFKSSLHELSACLLDRSSWERRHSDHDMYHADSVTILLEAIENSFVKRAKANDIWWQENEPEFRQSNAILLRYFLLKSYIANPEKNIDGICFQLTDDTLFRYGRIEYELGEVIQTTFHLIPWETQLANQEMILSLYENELSEENDDNVYFLRDRYNYLIWIPSIFRIQKSQGFISSYCKKFGTGLPTPKLHSWGGSVGAPLGTEELMGLNDINLFRLLEYYNQYRDRSTHPADRGIGGLREVEVVLGSAASKDPQRYLNLIPELNSLNLQSGYLVSILNGASDNLRYRFGRLRPPEDWKPVQPEPDGLEVAKRLLTFMERNSTIWSDGHSVARMVEACSEVLTDINSVERLTFLLFKLLKDPNPEKTRQVIFGQEKESVTTDDLRHDAINSVRGVAAGSAIRLSYILFEKEKETPELLYPLLRHFALDPVLSVRSALLTELPYLASKNRHWGDQIFSDIFNEPQTLLWPLGERYLYYQYHNNFEEVLYYLNRMIKEAPKDTGGSYGRIMALALLSEHIEFNELFQKIETLNSVPVWEGVIQVLTTNLKNEKSGGICEKGLIYILSKEEKLNLSMNEIERAFNPKNGGRKLTTDFASLFIDSVEFNNDRLSFDDLFDWISDLSHQNPIDALKICEKLADKLTDPEFTRKLWRTESLISALTCILREADETNDESLIQRAVLLQDKFLQMDLRGMDDFFEQACRT